MIVKHDARKQLVHQLQSFYGELSDKEKSIINTSYGCVIQKLEECFRYTPNKYYSLNGEVFFNPLHVSQYTMFLYTISAELRASYSEYIDLCDKIYGLLKLISSADIYYEIKLPDIWMCDHPQGSVMGRAEYSNFFSFSQGCTVGNNKGLYPRFEEHVTMFSNSKILGNCKIGNHVIMSANSYILDTDVPPYSIVFGMYPNAIIHKITQEKFNELTQSIFRIDEVKE